MSLLNSAIRHIAEIAKVPSFSTYEERLHPYINKAMQALEGTESIEVSGNSLIFRMPGSQSGPKIALAAHLDKINHYGPDFPEELPVKTHVDYIEGAMDDSAGLGILLALAEKADEIKENPELYFFFSEMEESKGLKEYPELLKNNGSGYQHGMGARKIARRCIEQGIIPDEVITIDTTPLFKGDPGVALYSKHWEYTDLQPDPVLIDKTSKTVDRFKKIDPDILLSNNTNDFLHYGYEFNKAGEYEVISVALEPAIHPYHQKGERVYLSDIKRVLGILSNYLGLPTA